MRLPIGRDQPAPAVHFQELPEKTARIVADRRKRIAEAIDVAHAFLAQLPPYRLEEIELFIKYLGNTRHLVTDLLHQRLPGWNVQCLALQRNAVKRPLLGDVVVELGGYGRGLAVLVLLRRDDVADIDELTPQAACGTVCAAPSSE
ncbi:MAG: hypothetical protein ACREFP_19300 [Acetobacteraceae bacterium]